MATYFAVLGERPGVYENKEDANAAVGTYAVPLVKSFGLFEEASAFLEPLLRATAIVYTDGACIANGKPGAKAGVGVFWGEGHPLNVSRPVRGAHTNNVAELEAIEDALDQILGIEHLHHSVVAVVTDSKYSIQCLTNWYGGFVARNWLTTGGTPVKNREILERMHAKLDTLPNVTLVHVRGHVGHAGNEFADALAVAGIASPMLPA